MSLYFRCNGAAIRLIEDEGVVTSPALHYRQGNRTHRIPLILPDGACYNAAQTVRYAYSASADRTLHVIYHGRRYVVPNTITPLIDIPAGTYAGYTAYGIFKNFISPNAYRVLKNKVTVSHRGIAKTFDAGTAVWLTHAYGGETINLTFTQQRSAMPRAEPGYNGNKEWWTDSARNAPTIQLHIRASHRELTNEQGEITDSVMTFSYEVLTKDKENFAVKSYVCQEECITVLPAPRPRRPDRKLNSVM